MKRQYKSFDFLLVSMVCSIAIFGIIVIGSASNTALGDVTNDYDNQKFWFVIGLIFMTLAAFIDYHFICNFYVVAYVVNLGLLILVLLIGEDATNTARWLRFGSVSLQPSEFSKIFMIIFLARFMETYQDRINKVSMLIGVLLLILLPVFLINKQPSLSAAMVLLAVSLAILFIGNLSYKYIIAALVIIVPLAVIFFIDIHRSEYLIIDKVFTSYQLNRINLFFFPDVTDPKYYQTDKSIQAIGSGLLYGKGLHNGLIYELNYVPQAHNDFVFAVVGEEFGFIGSTALLCAMCLVVLRCIYIAYKAADLTGKLIASGVAFMLGFQTFVNAGVATGLLPNTGMVFPFVSYGGSSMLVCMVAIGLCLNVYMSKPKSIFEG